MAGSLKPLREGGAGTKKPAREDGSSIVLDEAVSCVMPCSASLLAS